MTPKNIIIIVLLFLGFNQAFAQQYSCNQIQNYVKQNRTNVEYVNCLGSTMLSKAEYYTVDGVGYVIGYFKSNENQVYGTPYIFCGVPYSNWSNFRSAGRFNSWGEAFHKYIMNYKCNCY